MPDPKDDATFKVRDKRPFNPDGSLRETTEDESSVTEPSSKKDAIPTAPPTRPETEKQPSSASVTGSHLEPDHATSIAHHEHAEPTQDDIDYINFIYGLASNAFANLGVMPHPVTGEATVDLETAKHFIDIIGLLQKKTKGNLSDQEEKIVIELMRDLKMQYVSLANAPQK